MTTRKPDLWKPDLWKPDLWKPDLWKPDLWKPDLSLDVDQWNCNHALECAKACKDPGWDQCMESCFLSPKVCAASKDVAKSFWLCGPDVNDFCWTDEKTCKNNFGSAACEDCLIQNCPTGYAICKSSSC